MQTKKEPSEEDPGNENILLIDRFQMGRMMIKEYSVRDQFSEEKHPLGHTSVYFWQNKQDVNATIKVSATVTNSTENAHKAMDHFMSNLANPSVFFETSEGHLRANWLKKLDTVKVHMDSRGTELIAAAFIWGNIFFHIHSCGERQHSIKEFIDNLGDYWSFIDSLKKQKSDAIKGSDHQYNIELSASKTELKIGEEAILSSAKLQNDREFSSFLYVAFPKRAVHLYEENNKFKIKIKPEASKTIVSPRVIMVGVRPDGKYDRSNTLKFTITPS